MFCKQQNDRNRNNSSGRKELAAIATNITNILAKDEIVVQKRKQIYYGLGLSAGADFHKLNKDADNDAWIFFHTMLLQYFSSRTDTKDAHKKIVECLKSFDLIFCAGKVAALDSGSCLFIGEIFWHNMEDVCLNFVGREAEFHKLEQCLQAQNSTTESTVLTSVSGMGGIGKTTLARKFAYHFYRVLSGSVVWIPAENASLVTKEFTEIGHQLSITKKSSTSKFAKAIYEALMRKNDNVLFIFDNLDDPINKWIHEFLPNGLVARRPFILITSRRRDIIPQSSNVVDLDVLSLGDALQMIKIWLPEISSTTGAKLAEALQFYPLALQIALSEIGCIQSLNNDEATLKYIEDFDRNKAILLKQDKNLPIDYKLTLCASLKITLDKLGNFKCGNKILSLLRVISIIYPDELETEFIHKIFEQMEQHPSFFRTFLEFFGVLKQAEPISMCNEILEILCNHSILTVVSHSDKIYRIHRMIQYVIHQTSNAQQMKSAVKIMLKYFETVRRGFGFNHKELNHVEFVIKYCRQNKFKGLESHLALMKLIFSNYEKWTGLPLEFMSSFMMKHFGKESKVTSANYIEAVENDQKLSTSVVYAFLKQKSFESRLLPIIDPLLVAVLLLRDHYTSTISKINFHLLKDMFSVSEDDINHKFRPFSEEKFINIERKSEDDLIYVYIEKCFSRFFFRYIEINAEFKDQVKKFGEHFITRNFGLYGPLKLIHATLNPIWNDWDESNWNKMVQKIQNIQFIEVFYRLKLTYNKLYEILFSGSPLYKYRGLEKICGAIVFTLHLCKSISLLANGNSIILGFTKQAWTNLVYGYDWLFTSEPAHYSLLQETQKFVDRVNSKLSESELRNVKIYSLLAYLGKGYVPSELITTFKFPLNFEEKMSKLGLGIVSKKELYLGPLVLSVYAKLCDKTILIHAYRKILKEYTSSKNTGLDPNEIYLESCFLLHEICSSHFTDEPLLIFPITLILSYDYYLTLTARGVEKLCDLFSKSLECDQLKEKDYVVRLKNELKQCFTILDINMGEFESDLKYFINNLLSEYSSAHYWVKPVSVKNFNGIPVFIKDHQVLENIISRLYPPEL